MRLLETHIAKEQKIPIRIQEYAVGIFNTTTSRSAVKKAIKKKLILVDNIPVTTAKIIIGGEKITLFSSEITISSKKITGIKVS